MRSLTTVSPFAYAELYFARGVLWSEQIGDSERGMRMYRRALDYVPEFVAARIHLAELLEARGTARKALQLVDDIALPDGDPEALALRARLRMTLGLAGAAADLVAAKRRFAQLIARHPLAYADHAARFYLAAGNDPAQAWVLARLNLDNRPTVGALALAKLAADAVGQSLAEFPAAAPAALRDAAVLCAP